MTHAPRIPHIRTCAHTHHWETGWKRESYSIRSGSMVTVTTNATGRGGGEVLGSATAAIAAAVRRTSASWWVRGGVGRKRVGDRAGGALARVKDGIQPLRSLGIKISRHTRQEKLGLGGLGEAVRGACTFSSCDRHKIGTKVHESRPTPTCGSHAQI